MGADTPTLIVFSIALIIMISLLMIVFWARDGRPPVLLWLSMALLMGGASGLLVISQGQWLATPTWDRRIGAMLILVAHAFVWQAMRSLYGRKPLLIMSVVPPILWIILSDLVLTPFELFTLGACIRSLMVAAFFAAAAWELWRSRSEDLPSRRVLFWILTISAGIATLRALTTGLGGVPTSSETISNWMVFVFNFVVVLQALLVSIFSIILLRERTSMSNFQMALVDPMTGLANRRAFEAFLAAWPDLSTKPDRIVAVMFVDVDSFKQVNDYFGHEIGDRLLKAAARNLEQILGPGQRAFRVGGDEFVCILPGIDAKGAQALGDRLRTAFQFSANGVEGFSGGATLSIGVASGAAPRLGAKLSALLAEADAALRLSKQGGRNRTFLAADAAARGPQPEFADR